MFLLILGFAIGVYVGYAHPGQVEQAVDFTKKTVNDLKDKFGKKGGGTQG
ncbi:MAG: hypothetical protein WBW55_06410 [Desulfobaccales bacterium]